MSMKDLTPQLFLSMKQYTGKQFTADVISGIIVAIIALPLSIALALASGVTPEQGLYTAIVAGFIISFLGGSKVQIAGPTAAFATIVAGIVLKNGMEGLAAATILAGILLIVMGVLRLGSLIRFIPYTITTGFTTGIAVTIFIGQIKDFMGITFLHSPVETMEKLREVFVCMDTLNPMAVLIGAPGNPYHMAQIYQKDTAVPCGCHCVGCPGKGAGPEGEYHWGPVYHILRPAGVPYAPYHIWPDSEGDAGCPDHCRAGCH